MKVIELDLTGCKYWSELHERIKKAFGFPEWYGKNWDAFWDCIVDLATGSKPLNIEIIGLDILERKFGEDESSILLKCLKRAKYRADGIFANLMKIEIVGGDKRIEIQ